MYSPGRSVREIRRTWSEDILEDVWLIMPWISKSAKSERRWLPKFTTLLPGPACYLIFNKCPSCD